MSGVSVHHATSVSTYAPADAKNDGLLLSAVQVPEVTAGAPAAGATPGAKTAGGSGCHSNAAPARVAFGCGGGSSACAADTDEPAARDDPIGAVRSASASKPATIAHSAIAA